VKVYALIKNQGVKNQEKSRGKNQGVSQLDL